MKKVYKVMLHPGKVRSKNDGDIHHIGSARLARLYGVLPTDEVVTYDPSNPTHTEEYERRHNLNVIHLYPSISGDYYSIHALDEFTPNTPTI